MRSTCTALIFSFLVSLLFVTGPVHLPAAPQSMAELKRRVEKLGRLKFKKDIPVKYLERKWIQHYIGLQVDEQYPGDRAEKDALLAHMLGFTKKKKDLKGIRKKILLSNAGGLYHRKTKELLLIKDYRSINRLNTAVIAHELRHAILDTHFDLSTLLGKYSYLDDRELAALAAVNGDTAFIMSAAAGLDPINMSTTLHSDALLSFSPLGNTTQLYSAPELVKHSFTMPYILGLRFVAALFKKKKWKGLNRLLSAPPLSTEQVLHPEKYFKNEAPVPVKVEYRPDGYDLYHTGVIGEFYLNVLITPGDSYMNTVLGWGGDFFHLYTKDNGAEDNHQGRFLVWKSTWDNNNACGKAFYDFKRFVENNYDVNFKEGNVNNAFFIAGHSGNDYFFIRRIMDRMIYVRTNDRNQMNKFIYGGNYD